MDSQYSSMEHNSDSTWNFARSFLSDLQWSTAGPQTPQVMRAVRGVGNLQSQQLPAQQLPSGQVPNSSGQQQQQTMGSVPGQSNHMQFRSWLLDQGILDTTVDTLFTHGFTSHDDFHLMQQDDIEIMHIQPLAQRRRLIHLKASNNSPNGIRPQMPTTQTNDASNCNDQQQTLPIAALMQLLTQQQQPARVDTSENSRSNGEPGSFPIILSKPSKHLDIVDYLRHYEPPSEKVLVGKEGEEQVIIRSGNAKPKLDQVTPLQWTGASIRIMRDLILKGSLHSNDIDSYLSYMEKIADFASKYTWPSILTYDREYRRWQAQNSCTWGTDNIHLAEIHLDTRSRPSGTTSQKQGGRFNSKPNGQPNRSNEICRQYNLAKCMFGSTCKFQHKCLAPGCNATHTIMDHSKNDQSKNGQI